MVMRLTASGGGLARCAGAWSWPPGWHLVRSRMLQPEPALRYVMSLRSSPGVPYWGRQQGEPWLNESFRPQACDATRGHGEPW